jgi:F-type H+-transporting ATPase subunit b
MLKFSLRDFSILLVDFLVLVWLLNLILFRPMLKVFAERDENIRKARQMSEKRDAALAEMKKEMEAARQKAKKEFERLRAEGLERQKLALAGAHEEAMKLSEKLGAQLRAEAERARQALRSEVEKFSDVILEKLVKA